MRPPKPAGPFQFLVLLMAGWIHRRQQRAITYLQAENRVLRERLGTKRLRFTDAERRLLAERGKGLGRTMLAVGNAHNARDDSALVPPADRREVRWLEDTALPRETADAERRDGAAAGDGPREPLLARSPNLSAYAERFVGSIKSECLRHIVPMGERHLRAVVREYVEHYHRERNHQGLDNAIPLPLVQISKGAIRRYERLGGILGHYRRDAA